jgi:hypothetical protein
MSLKCPTQFCERTFSQRSAYSQHVQRCMKRTELETSSDSDSNSEKNENKVIVLISHLTRNTKI